MALEIRFNPLAGELQYTQPDLLASANTWAALNTFDGGIHLDDHVNLEFGSNAGGDVTLDFNGTDASMDRVTGSPNFNVNMPLFVCANIDEYSRFGHVPESNPSISDDDDILVAVKQNTSSAGGIPRRGALFICEYIGVEAINTRSHFGLNAFAYDSSGVPTDFITTTNGGGLVGGRYASRHYGDGTVTLGGGVAARAEGRGYINAYAFLAEGNGSFAVGITNSYNFWGRDTTTNVTTAYGFYQKEMTNATNNYEMAIEGEGGIWFNINNQDTEYINSGAAGELDINAATSINFPITGTEQVQIFDGKIVPTTDNDIDLGDGTHYYKDVYVKGEMKGSRMLIGAGNSTTSYSADTFLKLYNNMTMTTTLGWDMMRAGSVVGVSVTLNVTAQTTAGNVIFEIRDQNSVVLSSVTIAIDGAGDYKGYATQARNTTTFSADDVLTFYLNFDTFIGTIGKCQVLGEIVFDT